MSYCFECEKTVEKPHNCQSGSVRVDALVRRDVDIKKARRFVVEVIEQCYIVMEMLDDGHDPMHEVLLEIKNLAEKAEMALSA